MRAVTARIAGKTTARVGKARRPVDVSRAPVSRFDMEHTSMIIGSPQRKSRPGSGRPAARRKRRPTPTVLAIPLRYGAHSRFLFTSSGRRIGTHPPAQTAHRRRQIRAGQRRCATENRRVACLRASPTLGKLDSFFLAMSQKHEASQTRSAPNGLMSCLLANIDGRDNGERALGAGFRPLPDLTPMSVIMGILIVTFRMNTPRRRFAVHFGWFPG